MPTDRAPGKTASGNPPPPSDGRQEMDELRRRYERLRERRITAEADLKNANQELDRLKQEAREKYGTDDLAELTRMLEGMKRENERKRAEYQQPLDGIEARLADVEAQFTKTTGANE